MIEDLQTKLVKAAKSGNLDSFGDLAKSYYNSMVAIAYAVLADHHLAEDAVQQAFVKALTKMNTLKKPESFAAWLARICRNTANDIAKKRIKHINTDDLSHIPAKPNENPDGQIIKDAVNSLNSADKELITMRYYNESSYQQMSIVLGLTKPAINNRLQRAKQKIAKYLEQNSFEVKL